MLYFYQFLTLYLFFISIPKKSQWIFFWIQNLIYFLLTFFRFLFFISFLCTKLFLFFFFFYTQHRHIISLFSDKTLHLSSFCKCINKHQNFCSTFCLTYFSFCLLFLYKLNFFFQRDSQDFF